jgi:hypothetical protein
MYEEECGALIDLLAALKEREIDASVLEILTT